MNQSIRWWPRVLVVVMASVVCGCGFEQGMNLPRDDGPTTAEFRFETELIENAALVREDTMPRWQLGRYAFKRGADRLLVISRITSFAEKLTIGQKAMGKVPRRYDKNLERVWIVLPLGTQVGDTFSMEVLEDEFLTGYDEGYIDGEIFVQPIRLLGKITILEEHSDSIVIDIDMVVEPRRLPRWNYKRVETVPITTTGVRARPAELTAKERRRAAEAKANGKKHASEPVDQAGLEPQDPTTQPSDDGNTAATTQPADKSAEVQKYLAGKWIGTTQTGTYDLRFQFDPDGKFIYSTCRNFAHPMIKSGTYRIKRGYVILDVKFLGAGSLKDRSHMKHLTKPLEMFKIYPVDDNTVVMRMTEKDMFFRDPGVNEVRVSRGDFQDMFIVPPPVKGR